jgi:hypothetical protein
VRAVPPSPQRRLMTNRPADGEVAGAPAGNGRPTVQDGRVVSRAERRRQEKEARSKRSRPS